MTLDELKVIVDREVASGYGPVRVGNFVYRDEFGDKEIEWLTSAEIADRDGHGGAYFEMRLED
jgi:hypothetical protein